MMAQSLNYRGLNSRERGSALLIVFVLAACIAIALYMELPVVAFEAKRQREDTLVYRGNQYAQAVRLYFRAFKRYPTNIEALENTNRMRFLRKRFKDPLSNSDDWRFLHAAPNGVIIDSKANPVNNNNGNTPGITPAGQQSTAQSNQLGFGGAQQGGIGAGGGQANSPFSSFNNGSTPNSANANGPGLNAGQPPTNNTFGGAPGAGAASSAGSFGGFFSGSSAPPSDTARQAGVPRTGDPTSDSTAGVQRSSTAALAGLPQRPPAVRTAGQPSGTDGSDTAENGTDSGSQAATEAAGLSGTSSIPVSTSDSAAVVRSGTSSDSAFNVGNGGANITGRRDGSSSATPLSGIGTTAGVNSTSPFGSTNNNQLQSGGLAGVASKVEGAGIKVINDKTDYSLWEFYWDPSKDPMRGATGLQGGGQQNNNSNNNGGQNLQGTQQNNSFGNSNSPFSNSSNSPFSSGSGSSPFSSGSGSSPFNSGSASSPFNSGSGSSPR